MKHLTILVCVVALAFCGLAAETQSCCEAAKDGIISTVKLYIEAGRKGNSKIARQAFAPTATMSWSEKGTLKSVPIQSLYDYFDQTGPQTVSYENLKVTAMTPTVATVTVDTCFGKDKFTDMFALVRSGEKWQIVAKIYHLR